MVKRATLGVLGMLLLIGLFGLNEPYAKAQVATPSQAVITVSGVPTGTQGLAVGVTVDTTIVTLGSAATSSVSGALAVVGSMSEGVGIISTSGNLPASFTITVPLAGVAVGMSSLAVGQVLDMLGGTAIAGASALVDTSSVSVASSSSSTSGGSSTSSTSGGTGGALSADTITVTINGADVTTTNALNVTLSFTDETVASLDTGVTFMGTGATQLLTDVNTGTGILTVVWDGTITNNKAEITAMLKAGSMAGSTMIAVTKVEAAGGVDITSNVQSVVSPDTVTNSAPTTTTDVGTFVLVGPTSVVGPGKAAISFTAEDTPSSFTATLNGKSVDFVGDGSVGIAIVDLPASGDLDLDLAVTSGGMTTDVSLGSVTVSAGEGDNLPKVSSARAQNRSSSTTLRVLGKKFSKDTTSLEIVPTDRASSAVKIKGKIIKATYPAEECIPSGSYINVSTAHGTDAKKVKVRGSCDNPLVE